MAMAPEAVALAQDDGEQGPVEVGAGDEHAASTWRTSACLLRLGPTMKPGVSHSERIGRS